MNLLHAWNFFYFVAFVVFYWTRRTFILHTAGETKTLRRMDGVEKALLAGMAPGTFVLPLLYLFSPWLGFADYTLPAWVKWSGGVAMIVSVWLFWRSHADLGKNWSVSLELREGHDLVTNGVYRRVRHPMYTSIWLWTIAQGMLLENWLAGWSVVPAFAAMYFIRVPREERMMEEQFGDAYRDYMKRTGKLMPKF